LDAANAVYRFELGEDGKKPPRDSVGEGFTYHQLNPSGSKYNEVTGEYESNGTVAGHKKFEIQSIRLLGGLREQWDGFVKGSFPKKRKTALQ
jgi:hypothetical protein